MFEVSTVVVGDGREKEVHERRVLIRIIRMDHDSWHYEADQRHGELIVKAHREGVEFEEGKVGADTRGG